MLDVLFGFTFQSHYNCNIIPIFLPAKMFIHLLTEALDCFRKCTIDSVCTIKISKNKCAKWIGGAQPVSEYIHTNENPLDLTRLIFSIFHIDVMYISSLFQFFLLFFSFLLFCFVLSVCLFGFFVHDSRGSN